ncbi:MAG: hypothetical protein HY323_00710 [Betaproteobacteria bacterium]|nr:hypothetical protein [Betaproteobacteria bacterium]
MTLAALVIACGTVPAWASAPGPLAIGAAVLRGALISLTLAVTGYPGEAR